MISERDRDTIADAVQNAIETLNNMHGIVSAIESRKDDLNTFLESNFDQVDPEPLGSLQGLSSKLENLRNDIQRLDDIDLSVSENYWIFIRNGFVNYDWSSVPYAHDYVLDKIQTFVNQTDFQRAFVQDKDAVQFIREVPTHFPSTIQELEAKISSLRIFEKIKGIDGNIVMIGSNGSGKSTFSRQLRGKLSAESSLAILSAQHLLTYAPQDGIFAADQELDKVRNYQSQDKLAYDQYSVQSVGSELNQLISALVSLHTKDALDCYDEAGGYEKKKTLLGRTIDIWNYLIAGRQIKRSGSFLVAVTSEGNEYQFNSLSDGEKAIFYYIGQILLAKESSYVVVDEPENHLHVSICDKLWDVLEHERQDCSFIYLTHDIEFAASRVNATLIWNKSFTPPDNWEFETLKSIDDIPDSLLLALVGSKRDVCFCEGEDKGSVDYRLYCILFSNYNIIPVKGHEQVVAYTRAYNRNYAIFHHKAIGIVDRDYHSQEKIDEWIGDDIFVLKTNEVENLLCDLRLIEESASQFCSPETTGQDFLDKFWEQFEGSVESQALEYATDIINDVFRYNCLTKAKKITELVSDLETMLAPQFAEDLYAGRLSELKNIVSSKDYSSAIEITNLKKALTKGIANRVIVNNYEDRILDFLKHRNDLAEYLRVKYLPDIPIENGFGC